MFLISNIRYIQTYFTYKMFYETVPNIINCGDLSRRERERERERERARERDGMGENDSARDTK